MCVAISNMWTTFPRCTWALNVKMLHDFEWLNETNKMIDGAFDKETCFNLANKFSFWILRIHILTTLAQFIAQSKCLFSNTHLKK